MLGLTGGLTVGVELVALLVEFEQVQVEQPIIMEYFKLFIDYFFILNEEKFTCPPLQRS